MDRDELLQREARAWDALEAAVARVPDDRRAEEGVVPGWSTKDLVWHCGYWAGWAGGKIEAMAAGTYVDESHDDAYYDEENATINEEGRGLTWDEVHARASEMRERTRAAVGSLPELTDEAAEVFSAETFEHYEEHAAEIVAFADQA